MSRNDDNIPTKDWTEIDISQISEADYPINCENCGYCLTGLGYSDNCPECNTTFSRRHRLWNQHGPDAFFGVEDYTDPDYFKFPDVDPNRYPRGTFGKALLWAIISVAVALALITLHFLYVHYRY